MPTVNPTYDPQTRTWFLEDPAVEAPTLRALLAELRKTADSHKRKHQEWRIEGYYPLGVEVRHGAGSAKLERCVEQKTIAVPEQKPVRSPPAVPVPPAPAPKAPPPPRVRGPIIRKWETRHKFGTWDPAIYEQVLDMWAQGIKGNVIAEKLGLTTVNVSAHMVPHARAHGDPRAVRRMSHCGVKRGGRDPKAVVADRGPANKAAGTSRSSE